MCSGSPSYGLSPAAAPSFPPDAATSATAGQRGVAAPLGGEGFWVGGGEAAARVGKDPKRGRVRALPIGWIVLGVVDALPGGQALGITVPGAAPTAGRVAMRHGALEHD